MKQSKRQRKKIIGLFPELLGVGGIQEAGRLTAAALGRIARSHDNWVTSFQSINDAPRAYDSDKRADQLSS